MGPHSATTSTGVDASPASPPARPAVTRTAPTAFSEATARREMSDRDIRRKRPPALALLMRMPTALRVARVVSLLGLDFVGVALAIFTALVLKEAVHGRVQTANAMHGTRQIGRASCRERV